MRYKSGLLAMTLGRAVRLPAIPFSLNQAGIRNPAATGCGRRQSALTDGKHLAGPGQPHRQRQLLPSPTLLKRRARPRQSRNLIRIGKM